MRLEMGGVKGAEQEEGMEDRQSRSSARRFAVANLQEWVDNRYCRRSEPSLRGSDRGAWSGE
jgi:hypothetical protein